MIDNRPPNHGKLWKASADKAIVNQYQFGLSAVEIAKRHGRTVCSICSRLTLLGVLINEGGIYIDCKTGEVYLERLDFPTGLNSTNEGKS